MPVILTCEVCGGTFSIPDRKRGRPVRRCSICRVSDRRLNSGQRNEDLKAERKARALRNTLRVLEYLTTHPCVDCGEDDPVVLQFDHLDGTVKIASVSKMVLQGRSLEVIEAEISKCHVRCANCHTRRTAKQFNWSRAI